MSGDYESLYLVTDLQQDTLTVLMLLNAADRQVFKMPTCIASMRLQGGCGTSTEQPESVVRLEAEICKDVARLQLRSEIYR